MSTARGERPPGQPLLVCEIRVHEIVAGTREERGEVLQVIHLGYRRGHGSGGRSLFGLGRLVKLREWLGCRVRRMAFCACKFWKISRGWMKQRKKACDDDWIKRIYILVRLHTAAHTTPVSDKASLSHRIAVVSSRGRDTIPASVQPQQSEATSIRPIGSWAAANRSTKLLDETKDRDASTGNARAHVRKTGGDVLETAQRMAVIGGSP